MLYMVVEKFKNLVREPKSTAVRESAAAVPCRTGVHR